MTDTTFDTDLEIANALIHLEDFFPVIDYVFADHPNPQTAEILQSVMSAGILTGIVSALRASRGDFDLTYDPLVPDSPEGLL